jgi:ribose transport system permease protein
VVRHLLRDETGVAAVLVLLVLAVGIAHPDFLTRSNLTGTTHNASYVGLMAAGMVFALAMREVDLSVGGVYALGVTVGAICIRDGWSPWAAAVAVLAMSAALGAGNAVIATYLGLPTFITTLATAMVFRGAALALAEGKAISGLPQGHAFFRVVGGDLGGLPTAVWVLLATTVALAVLLTRTRFGAQVRAVGSNPDAAHFTGLPIVRTRIKAMALSASMAGLAAVLALAFFISGDPTIGQGYELSAIAAAIIGGTPLAGGRGSVPGAVIGALILAAVASALVFFSVPINWTSFATGAVILAAVAADSALRRLRERRD